MTQKKYISQEEMMAIPAVEISSVSVVRQPVVSVIMLAYNHAAYIRQAIESIVSQKLNTPFELLIGEDNSSDQTLAICKELQREYPTVIRLIASDENVGMHRNFARLWCHANGEYIAFCEGDDYWVDVEKLQKQLNFLESRSDYALCGTFTQAIDQDVKGHWHQGAVIKPVTEQARYSFADLISRYNFHFSSVMLRKAAVRFPKWFWTVYCVDRPIYLLAAQNGLAGLIPEVTSIYRQHATGNWAPLNLLAKSTKSIHLFEVMAKEFEPEYFLMFHQTLRRILWSYMSEAIKNRDLRAARQLFWRSLQFGTLKDPADLLLSLKVWVRLYVLRLA